MIAQAKWFSRRKYTGWGVSPSTWQGYVYILCIAAIAAVIQSIPVDATLKMVLTGILVAFICIDVLHVMASLKLDELEQKIEAIAERNAAWTMVSFSILSIVFVTTIGKELKGPEVAPVIIFPIIAGVIVKGITNYILERRGI
jgi:hypothetical protein